MINLNQEVEMTWINGSIKYYQDKGYAFTKIRDKFNVKLKDVSLCSNKYVEAICDYCGQRVITRYCDYNESVLKHNKYSCVNCKSKKSIETNIQRYGKRMYNAENISLEKLKTRFKERNYIMLEDKNKYDYITDKTIIYYKCEKHPNSVLHISYADFKNGEGCKYCGREKANQSLRTEYEIVKNDFKNKGLILLTKEYKNNSQKLEYICIHHPDVIQSTCYTNLKNIQGCRFCCYERNRGENHYAWNGGISDIYEYLRKYIEPWKKDSRKKCNSKCAITGKRSNLVHHLYSFEKIIEELFQSLSINRANISDFSNEEISYLIEKCLELHYKYGLGVCLSENIHKLFHKIYGRKHNTPEQFEEFRQRYLAGEFSDVV
jgi:hypothetical protein